MMDFIKENYLWIIIAIAIIAVVLVFLCIFIKGKKKTLNQSNEWIICLGEKENIKEVNGVGSRISAVLLDKEKIDRDGLIKLGVSNILTMSNKVTLVIENKASLIADQINEALKKA